MSDERVIPEGRFGRLARLATVGVRAGYSMLSKSDASASAARAAEVLGTLRGMAAKVGQMASYVDGVVPEEHREAYETAMKGLRSAAPSSSVESIRGLVERELKAPISELFSAWNDVPVASASIGQVHLARLLDGAEVAVKVQHTGIVEALESDLANAGMLESVIGVAGGRRLNSRALMAMVQTRFREELDYGLEARRQTAFREIHACDPKIVIPRVVAERSSARVLTMDYVRGQSFEDACSADEGARREWAKTLWRFVFRGNIVGGMFNADPHPGNYLFQPDGRVTFLDFGCVQELDPERRPLGARMHRAACAQDEGAFYAATKAMIRSRPGGLEAQAQGFVRSCFEPLFHRPYRIERAYAASLVDKMRTMTLTARGLPDHELFVMPPEMLFMNRLQFGFYSVLARMNVAVDYAAEEERFLSEAPA